MAACCSRRLHDVWVCWWYPRCAVALVCALVGAFCEEWVPITLIDVTLMKPEMRARFNHCVCQTQRTCACMHRHKRAHAQTYAHRRVRLGCLPSQTMLKFCTRLVQALTKCQRHCFTAQAPLNLGLRRIAIEGRVGTEPWWRRRNYGLGCGAVAPASPCRWFKSTKHSDPIFACEYAAHQQPPFKVSDTLCQ